MSTSSPARRHVRMVRDAAIAAVLALAWPAGPAEAVEFRVQVLAARSPGDVAGTVVSLRREGDAPAARPTTAVMDQRASAFVPKVLPVQMGARVSFHNSDRIRHQVYSFSKAKSFELPLYAGASAPPVEFDKPGVVVVGCNIHDGMIGYVVVLDTPYFGRAGDDGRVLIDAPPGRYRLQAWHSRRQGPVLERAVVLEPGRSQEMQVELGLAPAQRPGQGRLRALQDRLRRNQAKP